MNSARLAILIIIIMLEPLPSWRTNGYVIQWAFIKDAYKTADIVERYLPLRIHVSGRDAIITRFKVDVFEPTSHRNMFVISLADSNNNNNIYEMYNAVISPTMYDLCLSWEPAQNHIAVKLSDILQATERLYQQTQVAWVWRPHFGHLLFERGVSICCWTVKSNPLLREKSAGISKT